MIILLLFCLFECSVALGFAYPDFAHLENVYQINDVKGITFVVHFPEYEDDVAYGFRPKCLDDLHLKSLNPLLDWNDLESFKFKSPKNLYVAKLQNACVASDLLGTIYQGKQQLLFSISWYPFQQIFHSRALHLTKNTSTKHYKKLATVQGPTYFYHTIIDRLPSVMLLRDTVMRDPEVKLLIPKLGNPPDYLYQYLDLLGISKDRIEPAGNTRMCSVEELYFATPFLMEPIPKKLLIKMRNELIDASKKRVLSRKYNNNLIVVIQRQEKNRRIKNLDELVDAIKSVCSANDYEVLIYKAEGSVAEQIQIFNNAKIVIGLMASGQTNIIYTNPGTTIIDIRPNWKSPLGGESQPNNGGREWCWWLSSAFDLDYWPLPHTFSFRDIWVNCPIRDIKQILEYVVSAKRLMVA